MTNLASRRQELGIHGFGVPCQGELTIVEVNDGGHEFSVDHFTGGSSSSCSQGAGEHFRLKADGTLLYTTSYDPVARAMLVKVP